MSIIGIEDVRINPKHTSLLSCGEFGELWNSCAIIRAPAVALEKLRWLSQPDALKMLLWYFNANCHTLLQVSHRSVCTALHEVEHAYLLFRVLSMVLSVGFAIVMGTFKHCFVKLWNICKSIVLNQWFGAHVKTPKSHDFNKCSFVIS